MVNRMFAFDTHGHGEGLLPAGTPLRTPATPPDTPVSALKKAGLDACVICAVGDVATFGLASVNSWEIAAGQLASLKARVAASGGRIVGNAAELAVDANPAAPLAVVLGVEGLDFISGPLDAMDAMKAAGVRLVGPVHYTQSALGGICMDLRGNPSAPGTEGGLTALGKSVVDRACELRMVVDMTHANDRTILDAALRSSRPVICSHAGPRSACPGPRYLSDEAIKAIAASGGVVGMWPALHGPSGPADVDAYVGMMVKTASICGAGAIAIGTDFNGVMGYAAGYAGPADMGKVDEAMERAGFSAAERAGILGGNAARVFKAILG